MRRTSSSPPNPHSFTYLFSSCASLSLPFHGQPSMPTSSSSASLRPPRLHLPHRHVREELSRRLGRRVFDEMPQESHVDAPAWNAVISGYARCGRMEDAREVFETMPAAARNTVTWTSMVSGYAQNARYEEAVRVFLRMWREGGPCLPNEVTLASVLPACASLGALELGKRIHMYARENGFQPANLFVANALLEMYSKCGSVDEARRVFEEIGPRRNLCSWNSMIVGLAVHGRWTEALDLFHEMRARRVDPDDITFVGVLLACTHGGLVDQGRAFFRDMEAFLHQAEAGALRVHGGPPRTSRAFKGSLQSHHEHADEAGLCHLGALLGACSFHNNIEFAEIAAGFLVELEPWNPGNFVIMSNIYASSGHWDGVAKLWKMKKGMQHRKAAGHSSIELDGEVHKFLVEDKSHPRTNEIYGVLDEIHERMRPLHHHIHIPP